MGDFNHTDLRSELQKYHQLVRCATRGERTLDHCYSTIKEAYRACASAPLGNGDHAVIKLIPTYRSLLKKQSKGLYRNGHPLQLNHYKPALTLQTGKLLNWHAITLSIQTHAYPTSTSVRNSAFPDNLL